MTLTPQFLDELRTRTHLSGLIGKSVKLAKAGREYKGCCPFHQEKTPSFYVNDEKGFYHCFGCSAHGDAIRFLTEVRGLPFIDAVKELAQAAGLEMPAPDRHAAEKAERQTGLQAANEAAAGWFGDQLQGIEGAAARDYLKRRGIPEALAKAFGFGFAPDSRGKLKGALARFGNDTLVEAGLLIKVEEKEPYDRFRGRLMIPIRDQRGRTIAFGGRILDQGEPKYLNTPDTPLFDKGRTLFNIDRAGPASRKAGRLIVVEGYMDVVALAKAGIDEAVAPNGTAVTEAQLERMWRLAEVPILCLDGDKAGLAAALRAANRALPNIGPSRSLRIALLPAGSDPDDLVNAGGREAIEDVLARAKHLADYLWSHNHSVADLRTPEGRSRLKAVLAEAADTIRDASTRTEYHREFKGRFFEEFGWKPRFLQVIEEKALSTVKEIYAHLMESYVRAAVYGLSRFPTVAADRFDDVADLPIKNRDVGTWRDNILEALEENPRLDADAMAALLEQRGRSNRQKMDLGSDLLFGFTRRDRGEAEAIEQLAGLVEGLAIEPKLFEALAQLDKLEENSLTAVGYAQLQAERQDIWRELGRLRQRSAKLGGLED